MKLLTNILDRFAHKRVKKECSKCKSKNTIPIIYGLISQNNYPKNVYLGGCTIPETHEDTYCEDCEHKFITK